MTMRFGPAGNAAAFYEQGFKSSDQMPAWLHKMGLTAYEYSCGRGVRIQQDMAQKIAHAAAENGIAMSLHAPYFINLVNLDAEKRAATDRYFMEAATACARMGGTRVVFHPGALLKKTRAEALAIAKDRMCEVLAMLDDAGLGAVHLCPETVGKVNQFGNLEEVLALCALDTRMVPTLDFGHLHAAGQGAITCKDDYARLLDRVEEALGVARARRMHVHFSRLEYSKGGEKRHWTFDDVQYGPDFAPLGALFAARGYCATVICESAGTQARDALAMKKMVLGD
nr:TIM barrel protein [Maliibacterium massiliense]